MYQYRPILQSYSLARRQNDGRQNDEDNSQPTNIGLVIIVSIIGFIIAITFIYCCLRSLRRRHSNPKYVPGPLKKLWRNWGVPARGTYAPASSDAESAAPGPQANATRNNSARVNRNTSIRSIITLPPYRMDATNTEQVLGREGERDGVDVVVELPTAENLETLREEEMESLYQIRVARRQQIAEREQRRDARREARERHDAVALDDLIRAQQNTSTADRSVLEELRRDHDRVKRQRLSAVSSVSYAEVGVARHDGTRVRGNSTESERVGLLSDAASIALSTRSADRRSSLPVRERSDSALSINTEIPSPSLHNRSRASSRAGSTRMSTQSRADSDPEVGEADVGDANIPLHSPPGYEGPSDGGLRSPENSEPPPDYPGRGEVSPESDHGVEGPEDRNRIGERRSVRMGVDGSTPQLPSLRLSSVPQIVIETEPSPSRDQPNRR